MKKHCFILWTRPEIIKLYSCIKYCERNSLDFFIIHTNQHYSANMDQVFFDELGLPPPKYNLWVNGWTHGQMTGKMMIEMEKVLQSEMPDVVYVQGDTNTVLAGALVASKMGIKVAHIEAGLRSYDRTMPEEINRIVADHVSDFCFSVGTKQSDILRQEGIEESKIFPVGNTIVDAVLQCSVLMESQEEEVLSKYGVEKDEYVLFTSHRPSNVDQSDTLKSLLEGMEGIRVKFGKKVLFPIHPRTRNNCAKFGLDSFLAEFNTIEPVGFLENLVLEKNAYVVATDSGGMQEEACILQKRNLILRENTERPETIEVWGAILVGNDARKILDWYVVLQSRIVDWYNPFWDGKTAERIFELTNR